MPDSNYQKYLAFPDAKEPRSIIRRRDVTIDYCRADMPWKENPDMWRYWLGIDVADVSFIDVEKAEAIVEEWRKSWY